MGKAGWDKNLTQNCLANFGNDGGNLLLSTAGFEMGAPLMSAGRAGDASNRFDAQYVKQERACAGTRMRTNPARLLCYSP